MHLYKTLYFQDVLQYILIGRCLVETHIEIEFEYFTP